MPDTIVRETIPQQTAPDARVAVDLTHQYVSGGSAWWYGNAARSLPWQIDDISLAFGDDLYDKMMTDPIVASAVNIFKAGILAEGVTLSGAIADRDDPDYGRAAELVDWCERVLADLEGDLDVVLWNMLDALPYGNKVAELIWETDRSYAGTEQVVLRAAHVKPRRSVAMVVDPYKKLLGMLGLLPGQNAWPLTGIQIADLAQVGNFVPAEKFLVLTNRMADNDPRGTSILRPAYDPWWRKEQTKSQHLKFLGVFAMASLVGFTAKGAQPTARRDAAGNLLHDQAGNPVMDYPTDVMRDALLAFQNGTVAVFPDGSADGSRVQVIPAQGSGEPFLQAFTGQDQEIVRAILTSTLGVAEGQHASRAQASVHQDSQHTIIGQSKRGVCSALRTQVLMRAVAYNYGPDARRLAPKVSLGGTEQEDIAKVWTAVAALATAGYLDPSQLARLDVQVNLPERDTVEAGVDGVEGADETDPADRPPAPGAEPPGPAQPPAPAPRPRPQPARKEAA